MSLEPGKAGLNQHSGSEREPQIASATACLQTNGLTPRSCHACNRRKTKCDKERPCSSCVRSGKPCVYPASGPRMRRSKKTIAAEMASRITCLEKALAKATSEKKSGRPGPRSSHPETTKSVSLAQGTRKVRCSQVIKRSREDILVQRGSPSQYFNEILLSRVIEEVSFNGMIFKRRQAGCLTTDVGTRH